MVCMCAKAVFTMVDDEPRALVQLLVGQDMQVDTPMPDEALVLLSFSLRMLVLLMRYLSIAFQLSENARPGR